MDEQAFIYGKLKILTEQIDYLFKVTESQQDMIENLTNIIEKMQSPEYARRQVKTAEMIDVADKLAFIRNINSKKK